MGNLCNQAPAKEFEAVNVNDGMDAIKPRMAVESEIGFDRM